MRVMGVFKDGTLSPSSLSRQVIKMLMMPISFVCSVEVAANGSHDLTNAGDEEK